MALSWSGIDLGRWIEFGSRREVYREREKNGWPRETDFGSRVWSDYLIIRVDGDHSEASLENTEITSQV